MVFLQALHCLCSGAIKHLTSNKGNHSSVLITSATSVNQIVSDTKAKGQPIWVMMLSHVPAMFSFKVHPATTCSDIVSS